MQETPSILLVTGAGAGIPRAILRRSEGTPAQRHRDQHRAGRAGRREDVAEAVACLHTEGFVTGQALNVDGGMTVKMIYED